MTLTWEQSIGLVDTHLVESDFDFNSQSSPQQISVHPQVKNSLIRLLTAAKSDNVEITIVSGFRNFARQLKIWNEKWLGYRPVYSRHGRPLNISQLSNIEKYKAIALWSALPGMSRHHWGTDFDIFAATPIEQGYNVQLIPTEFSQSGPCEALEYWLQNNLEKFGFFRPYRQFKQGVSQEPWHISHLKTAEPIREEFDLSRFRQFLQASDIQAVNFIGQQLEHYHKQYFCNICLPSQEGQSLKSEEVS